MTAASAEVGLRHIVEEEVWGDMVHDTPQRYWEFMTDVAAPVVAGLAKAGPPDPCHGYKLRYVNPASGGAPAPAGVGTVKPVGVSPRQACPVSGREPAAWKFISPHRNDGPVPDPGPGVRCPLFGAMVRNGRRHRVPFYGRRK